jgi:hypothetical protein
MEPKAIVFDFVQPTLPLEGFSDPLGRHGETKPAGRGPQRDMRG